MTKTTYVYQGVWRDYSRPWWNGWQWTMEQNAAVAMTNLIAVSLALGLSRVPILFKPLFPKHDKKQHNTHDRNREISNGTDLDEHSGPNMAQGPAVVQPAHIAGGTADPLDSRWGFLAPFRSIEAGLAKASKVIFRGRVEVGSEDTGARKVARHVAANAREDPLQFYGAIIFAVLLVALFVLEQSLAILSSNIITGSKVLSVHPDCGAWVFSYSNLNWSDPDAQERAGLLELSAEKPPAIRSLNYAERCYSDDGYGIENCNIMVSRTIDYVTTRNAPCPFADGVCQNGNSSALIMDTGFQPFSVLGLNAPHSALFRRRVTCAPLTDHLTRLRIGPGNSTYTVEYLYGYPNYWGFPDSEYNFPEAPITWSHVSPYEDVPVGEYETRRFSNSNSFWGCGPNFAPVPELYIENGELTILLLRTNGTYFAQEQTDPLFATNWTHPTKKPFGDGSMSGAWYTRLSPTATALGCVEFYEICLPRKHENVPFCFNFTDSVTPDGRTSGNLSLGALSEFLPDSSREDDLALARFAFAARSRSSLFCQNTTLGAQALNVMKKKIFGGFYHSLPDNQWEIEAENYFNISLARSQLNAFAMATGERRGDGGVGGGSMAELDLLSWGICGASGCQRRICSALTLEGIGWQNVSLFWFVALLTFSVCVATGSVKLGEKLIAQYTWACICAVPQRCYTSLITPALKTLKETLLRWKIQTIPSQVAAWFRLARRRTTRPTELSEGRSGSAPPLQRLELAALDPEDP